MKKLLFIFCIIFPCFANVQDWKLIGLSGTVYNIKVIRSGDVYFVPSYQIWRHLNFGRAEKGDTITARFDGNELKFARNSDKYLFNGSQRNLSRATIYRDGINYCEMNSFFAAMTLLCGLRFDVNVSGREIRINKAADNISGIIVIDPGHGGKDPGAMGPGGLMEKDVVLAISLELKKLLAKHKDLNVYMTREKDVFVPLRRRTKFANQKNADLFISIHANASERSSKISGYKMYFLSEANNESDEWTARLENSVIDLEDESDISGLEAILSSLAISEYIRESQDFSIMLAKSFDRNIKEVSKLHTGVGQANFYVLVGALMPAVLVETAFISNPKEEKLLKDKKFQTSVAEGISEAVVEFFKKYSEDM